MPIQPIPSGLVSRMEPLKGIKAVAFDVYGTLLISDTGQMLHKTDGLHVTAEEDRKSIVLEAAVSAGIKLPAASAGRLASDLDSEIRRLQLTAKAAGIVHPESDIRDVWTSVLRETEVSVTFGQIERLAVEYEIRVNRTWPMPGALGCLQDLYGSTELGIISNAQFLTPLILDQQLGSSFSDLIPRDQCFWSYEHGHAKPGKVLFEIASDCFEKMGIDRCSCLFVGNDMRNDIWAAATCGWRTALFAGDARTLKLRKDDERCRSLRPDLTINTLAQLPPLIQ